MPGTAFHAVRSSKERLEKAGFVGIRVSGDHPLSPSVGLLFHLLERNIFSQTNWLGIQERDNWSKELEKGGKYYFTRNESTLIAFAIGKKWEVSQYETPIFLQQTLVQIGET